MKILRCFAICLSCTLSLSLLSSCAEKEPKPYEQGKPTGRQASVELKPTEGNTAKGKVSFIELDKGIKVIADVEGLPAGEHGFHIHEFGDCSTPDASSAGAHFNPDSSMHAGPEDNPRHVGDLGNITIDKTGKGHYERTDFTITFDGPNSILGKSVILHEKQDDFISQPTGNAGARFACGVITLDEEKE